MRVLRAASLLAIASCGHAARVNQASSNVYARSDSDATTIVSPALLVGGTVGPTTVTGAYSMDAWTGASIDVVTAATPAIHERRHEGSLAVAYTTGPVTVNTAYRLSLENDYVSHGLTVGTRLELANKNTTIGADLLASADTVGRADDPSFAKPVRTLGGRLTLVQVIDRNTLAELGWQTITVDGFQASPYRFVALGDMGVCGSLAPFCIPEQVPDQRIRNALTIRVRRALGKHLSSGLDYRFYFDDWGIASHAIEPELGVVVGDHKTISLRYRYTTQSEAFFYRPRYFDIATTDGFVTRDRKLSALVGNEAGLQYMQRSESDTSSRAFTWGLRSTLSRADYLAFVGLDHVWAFELTALFGVER